MDEIAKIYIEEHGNLWRIKVFQQSIGIERQQPYVEHASNLLFDKSEFPDLYNEQLNAWNLKAIDKLINHYEAAISDDEEDTSEWN